MLARRRAQIWRHQPQFRRPRHFHEEPEINVVVKGHGMMGIGERNRPISAGDVLLFWPGQDHVLLDASEDFDLFVMALRPELAERAGIASIGASIGSQSSFRLPFRELRSMRKTLAGLGDVNDATSHETRVTDLFARLRSVPMEEHVLTRRALQTIVGDPAVSLSALADRFRTTASSVSRHYHRDLGVTLVEHRSRIRLIRFVSMVDEGMELTDAALAADFGSYAQFHRAFRRAFGCAPRDYFSDYRAAASEATFASVEAGVGPWARPRLKDLPK